MGKLLAVSLDVKKISKERLFQGNKGTYLKLTISLNDQIDQYGNNVSVWEEQTSEERNAKVTRNFLGNGKVIFDGGTGAGNNASMQQKSNDQQLPDSDLDLPF